MSLGTTTEQFNHVGLVVTDLKRAEEFYVDLLGFWRHPAHPSWIMVNGTNSIHLIEIPDAREDPVIFHEIHHLAFQIPDLEEVRSSLLDRGITPFQMDFQGNTRDVSSRAQALDFGIGTLFAADPGGNLLEFLQVGRGVFQKEVMSVRPPRGRGKPEFQVKAINHACSLVPNADEARRFYGEVLGLPRDARDPDGDWFVVNGKLGLHTAPAPEVKEDPSWFRERNHFALEVDDVTAVVRVLQGAGHEVFRFRENLRAESIELACAVESIPLAAGLPPMDTTAFVRDPDGNLIEFGTRHLFGTPEPVPSTTGTG